MKVHEEMTGWFAHSEKYAVAAQGPTREGAIEALKKLESLIESLRDKRLKEEASR